MEAAPWVDAKAGLVNRAIFADPAIARLEQERIFRRCWQFVGHIGQIRSPGDFTAAYLGEDPILVVMQEDGSPAAFLNVCRHRGMQICRAELGNAATFACPYHSWWRCPTGPTTARPSTRASGAHCRCAPRSTRA
jgi:phenylpropionate dioxygenase-like ring-hydroxylating dioxygenase large terminal subunit